MLHILFKNIFWILTLCVFSVPYAYGMTSLCKNLKACVIRSKFLVRRPVLCATQLREVCVDLADQTTLSLTREDIKAILQKGLGSFLPEGKKCSKLQYTGGNYDNAACIKLASVINLLQNLQSISIVLADEKKVDSQSAAVLSELKSTEKAVHLDGLEKLWEALSKIKQLQHFKLSLSRNAIYAKRIAGELQKLHDLENFNSVSLCLRDNNLSGDDALSIVCSLVYYFCMRHIELDLSGNNISLQHQSAIISILESSIHCSYLHIDFGNGPSYTSVICDPEW